MVWLLSQMKKILLLILCAFLMGCATTSKDATKFGNVLYRDAMDSWLGADMYSFTNANGLPLTTLPASNGNKIYMWSDTKKLLQSATSKHKKHIYRSYNFTDFEQPSRKPSYDRQSITLWCDTYVEADSTGRIIRWRGEGNYCEISMKMQSP